jgi:hypothetical protein
MDSVTRKNRLVLFVWISYFSSFVFYISVLPFYVGCGVSPAVINAHSSIVTFCKKYILRLSVFSRKFFILVFKLLNKYEDLNWFVFIYVAYGQSKNAVSSSDSVAFRTGS